MFEFILEILFELSGNLVCAGVLALPIILGARDSAKRNKRTVWEELMSDE